MPYIAQTAREELANNEDRFIETAGELNYIFTSITQAYINRKGLSYQTINDILGALEGTKLEFYRRIVIGYEGKKLKENGDVYE